ncbi:hypothetical protein HY249_02965 [Candidatus Azambacteria bacterium]|nr:hypothetical protein [Candidatus Azambacteria bacterium]
MNEILPAIIAKDLNELKEKIQLVEGLVSWVQIDVMDGIFVPPETWYNPEDLKSIKTSVKLEAHLMVQDPDIKTDEWIKSGVNRVLIHYESASSAGISEMIDKLKAAGIEVGLSFKMETDFHDALDLLAKVDAVQFMSIGKIGYYGQDFDARVMQKIIAFKNEFPNVKVCVDGGVNFESAKELLNAGVDRLAVGSLIFKSDDIKNTILKLQNL